MKLQGKLSGRYKLVAVNAKTGKERVLADWFDNLITDQGLNRLASSENAHWAYCHVGSGSAPPVNGDGGLQSFVAATGNRLTRVDGSQVAVSPYYGFSRYTYRFAQGAAAGNLSEVGTGWGPSGNVLFSRALIKDSGGNPTTITVLSDEFLDVTWEIRSYMPMNDVAGSFTMAGQTYATLTRAADANNWNPDLLFTYGIQDFIVGILLYAGDIGPITGLPSNPSSGGSSQTLAPYVNNSLQRTGTVNYGLANANFENGVKSARVTMPGSSFQIRFTPAIPKTDQKIMSLNFTMSWARYAP